MRFTVETEREEDFRSRLRPHNAVAQRQSKAVIGGFAASQVAGETAEWLASHALSPRFPGLRIFSVHDNEEIGPAMLVRIAKHTGLRPEDL